MAQPFLAIIGIQHAIISETMRIRGIGSVEYFQNARCVSCAAQPEIKPLVEIRLIVRTDIQLDIGGILNLDNFYITCIEILANLHHGSRVSPVSLLENSLFTDVSL